MHAVVDTETLGQLLWEVIMADSDNFIKAKADNGQFKHDENRN